MNYVPGYNLNNLCGTSCAYSQVNAGKDGFGLDDRLPDGTSTVSSLTIDFPMRSGGIVGFSCLPGFSLLSPSGSDTTTAPTITCVNGSSGIPQIQYSDNRCISINYCTLNSSTSGAGDVDFSNTDCHQPGILCKKTGSTTNSIIISTGQNAIVNCGGGVSGTKTYSCDGSLNLSQSAGTCSGSCSVSSTAAGGPIANWGSYKLTSGTSLSLNHNGTTPSSATGISCNSSSYYNGLTPQYTCNNGQLILKGCYPSTVSTSSSATQLTPSLWLEAKDNPIAAFGSTKLNDDPISSWISQSPDAVGGNVIAVSQATTTNQPTYKTATNGINNNPALQFDGSDDNLSNSLNINSLLGNAGNAKNTATVFIVQHVNPRTSGTSHASVWWGNSNNDAGEKLNISAYNIANSLIFDFGQESISRFSSLNQYIANPTVLSFVKNGNNMSAYINSASIANQTTSTTSNNITDNVSKPFSIGGKFTPNLASSLNGKIAEVIVYKEALSDNQRTAVENYLKAKWNIR